MDGFSDNLQPIRLNEIERSECRLLSTWDVVDRLTNKRPQSERYLERWDALYESYNAEFCDFRRSSLKEVHGVDLEDIDSFNLCLIERYTACVNFSYDMFISSVAIDQSLFVGTMFDELLRDCFRPCQPSGGGPTTFSVKEGKFYFHVCDILPIVIGSRLDKRLRHRLWADRALSHHDEYKRGFLILNKNLYHFTTCLSTNPKICHVYHRNGKVKNFESRLYVYDKNFRGHMLTFRQFVLLERCVVCCTASSTDGTTTFVPVACNGVRVRVLERLMLRNCFKHDYLLMERFCPVPDNHSVLLSALRDHFCLSPDDDLSCARMLGKKQRNLTLPGLRSYRQKSFCDCSSVTLRKQFDRGDNGELKEMVGGEDDAARVNVGSFVFSNIEQMHFLVANCFLPFLLPQPKSDVYVKFLSMYLYMRQILLCQENIDSLSNKCVYDGSILYASFMYQLGSYLCVKYRLEELYDDSVQLLISRSRELSLTGNLLMLISSKANIRPDSASDIKRQLKMTAKRERAQAQMFNAQQHFNLLVNKNFITGNNAVNLICNIVDRPVVFPVETTSADSTQQDESPLSEDDVVNANCDFILNRRSNYSNKNFITHSNKNFFTGLVRVNGVYKMYLTSSVKHFISRQVLNYSGNVLLQCVPAPSFTDTEYLFELLKRHTLANQQNSNQCSLRPIECDRFISYYNIGNMRTAGRAMNVCSASRTTLFTRPYKVYVTSYISWLVDAYRVIHRVYSSIRCHDRSRVDTKQCLLHRRSRCYRCFCMLVVNEVPFNQFSVDRSLIYVLFACSKYFWPDVQVYSKRDNVLSVSVMSGVLMIPFAVCVDGPCVRRRDRDRWLYCSVCDWFLPCDNIVDRASNLFYLNSDSAQLFRLCKSQIGREHLLAERVVPTCEHHVWMSSNEVIYYQTALREQSLRLGDFFYYEVACHGLFQTGRNARSVDLSKAIVSINASRRRLRFFSQMRGRGPEWLVDQNSRLFVYDHVPPWRVLSLNELLADSFPAPLERIHAVADKNSFVAFFMFGDYMGYNCLDAYVFDNNSRPLAETCIQLKVNYYKIDRSTINQNQIRFAFNPIVYPQSPCGCTLFLCEIVSEVELSFGSTMMQVKVSRLHNRWVYRFFYVMHYSYLRKDSEVFRAASDSETSLFGEHLRFDVRENDVAVGSVPFAMEDESDSFGHMDGSSSSNSSSGGSCSGGGGSARRCDTTGKVVVNDVRVLYEAFAVTRNGNIELRVHVNTRQIRFQLLMKRVKTVQKIQNNCGQKGMATYVDLSRYVTADGGNVHLIVSQYSMLGRKTLAQIYEQYSNAGFSRKFRSLIPVYDRVTGRLVGHGGYGMYFESCDSAHDNIIAIGANFGTNPTRLCNLSYSGGLDNNLSTTMFLRSSDYENFKNTPVNGIPSNIMDVLSVYRYYNRSINVERSSRLRVRRLLQTYYFLRLNGIRARLPERLRSYV